MPSPTAYRLIALRLPPAMLAALKAAAKAAGKTQSEYVRRLIASAVGSAKPTDRAP